MKKQAIFIYDLKSNKMVEVCDLRALTPEQFDNFVREAKANAKALVKQAEEKENLKELEHQKVVNDLQEQINNLRFVIKHILGYEELGDDVIQDILYFGEEPKQEDQPNVQ